MRVPENGRQYDVVILSGFTIAEGVKLLGTRDYPNMAADFARTFQVLKRLSCDVFGAQHPYFFNMEVKVKRIDTAGPNPLWIQPATARSLRPRRRTIENSWRPRNARKVLRKNGSRAFLLMRI
jgi:hypothetical protein